jgi:hypothetical protein
MSNFVAKIIKESALVYDIRLKRGELDTFMILQVEKSKHANFLKKMEGTEPFDATEFGTILHQGLAEPNDALKEELREKYGMYS